MKVTSHIAAYPRPFSTSEASEWAGMSKRKLLELARQGAIPEAKKIDGTWHFGQHGLALFFGIDD